MSVMVGAIFLIGLGSMINPEPAKAVSIYKERTAVTRPTTKSIPQKSLNCLASAIWYEAGNQPREGKIAVAEVILTRTRSAQYPDTICSVIRQPHQFSFVKNGWIPGVPNAHQQEMMIIAKGVYNGQLRSRVQGAMHFHADYVSPQWGYRFAGQIGDHLFFTNDRTRRSALANRPQLVSTKGRLPGPWPQKIAGPIGGKEDIFGLAKQSIDRDHTDPAFHGGETAVERVIPVVSEHKKMPSGNADGSKIIGPRDREVENAVPAT